MVEPRKARGRTEVELPDGRHMIVIDGDLIPDNAKVVGDAKEPGFRDAKARGRRGADLVSDANGSTPERRSVERQNEEAAEGKFGPVAQAAANPGTPSATHTALEEATPIPTPAEIAEQEAAATSAKSETTSKTPAKK